MNYSSDIHLQIRIDRKVSIAVLLSLLIHLLLLFFLSRQDLLNQHQPAAQRQTMVVQLDARRAQKTVSVPVESPAPEPPKLIRKPEAKHRPMPTPPVPKAPATVPAMPAIAPPSVAAAQHPPVPPSQAVPQPPQATDMMSYVKAARERRRLAGENVDSANDAPPTSRLLSEDDARMANIQRNLQQSGTNGVFQILSMDRLTATFAFRGWKNELSYSHREVYQVDALRDGEIRRAVIRKMIEIIRRYYDGNFNWESQRLGRVVVLSARLQDNDGLEDFLMQEFFGPNGIEAR